MHLYDMLHTELEHESSDLGAVDPLVCFCFRLSESKLKQCYKKCGSLEKLKSETKAGTACRGCLPSLIAIFQEQDGWHTSATATSSCSSPGTHVMKGLLLSLTGLDTRVVAANSPAPQVKSCDLTTTIDYIIVDHLGQPVRGATVALETNQNFEIDTAELNLPKPFVGQILYQLGRKNRCSGRLSTQWYTASGVAATHENGATGRPRVYCPIRIDQKFMSGNNRLHLVLVNPEPQPVPFTINLFSRRLGSLWRGNGVLGNYGTFWIDTEKTIFSPVNDQGSASWTSDGAYLSIESNNLGRHGCLSCYVFTNNSSTGHWTCQHL